MSGSPVLCDGSDATSFARNGTSVAREARVLAADNTESALRAAGILKAGVVVAGTDNDTVNLGVTTLARRLNPDIFVIVRQNDAALIEP